MLQIRLAVHAALACVRDCVADLENLSASIIAAQIFQVRWQESKVLEQGVYPGFVCKILLSGREPKVTVRASRDGVEAEMPVASIVGVRVGSEYGSAR